MLKRWFLLKEASFGGTARRVVRLGLGWLPMPDSELQIAAMAAFVLAVLALTAFVII